MNRASNAPRASSHLLAEGKLASPALDSLLALTARGRREVLVGAEAGEDAAVVRGARRLVLTADPITFTEQNIGVYTVAVNCNDIVAMGGRPLYLTTTILLPPQTKEDRLRALFEELGSAAKGAGVLWVGGHTEVSSAVNRIVVSAQTVGVLTGRATRSCDARAGEALVMSKWVALEATTLIAREKPKTARRLLGPERYDEVLDWLYRPGISILEEGRLLKGLRLGAAHDPTEGGIATGVREIAERSGVGVRLFRDRIPIRPETELLCRHFGIDPLGALSSGVFLFTAAPSRAARACRLLSRRGLPAAVIGEITTRAGELLLSEGDDSRPLPAFERDEIVKIFDGA